MADMHTPLPWKTKLSRDGSGDVGITADGLPNVLAEVFGDIHHAGERNQMEATANAVLIVTAVNERPALLETVKALEAKLTAIRNKIPMSYLQRHDVAGATGPTSECDIVAAMADFSAARWEMIGRLRAADEQIATKDAALDEAKAALTDLDVRLIDCGPLHTAEDAYDTTYRGMVMDALVTIDVVLAGSAS